MKDDKKTSSCYRLFDSTLSTLLSVLYAYFNTRSQTVCSRDARTHAWKTSSLAASLCPLFRLTAWVRLHHIGPITAPFGSRRASDRFGNDRA